MRFVFLVVAFVTFLLDRVTKILAVKELHHPVDLIPGFLTLRFVENRGAAFSLFAGSSETVRKLFLLVIPVAVVLAVFYYAFTRRELSLRLSVALGLIAGGALGNLYDRFLKGSVVDFIDFHLGSYHYPTFNVADVGVFLGTVLLIFSLRKS